MLAPKIFFRKNLEKKTKSFFPDKNSEICCQEFLEIQESFQDQFSSVNYSKLWK